MFKVNNKDTSATFINVLVSVVYFIKVFPHRVVHLLLYLFRLVTTG